MMKKRHVNFSKIKQFRNVVTDIKHAARFSGLDENDEPIYNNDKLPTVTFTGTIKIHGTNAGVCYNGKDIWVQSRSEVKGSGHFGFVDFVNENIEDFKIMFSHLQSTNLAPTKPQIWTIFGEWCGPGVQKGVGVSQLPEKMFVIFGAKLKVDEEEGESRWVEHKNLRSANERIMNIYEYPVYQKDIDFEQPKIVINELIDITNKVEAECPVAAAHGVSGVGEGIVWSATYKGNPYRFKVKGSKHSPTKTKQLASVDPEKLRNIKETVDYLVTTQRYEQALQETGASLDRKDTGTLMRWLANDIMSEEEDTLKANELTWKDVAGEVTGAYRRMFFKDIDENL